MLKPNNYIKFMIFGLCQNQRKSLSQKIKNDVKMKQKKDGCLPRPKSQ